MAKSFFVRIVSYICKSSFEEYSNQFQRYTDISIKRAGETRLIKRRPTVMSNAIIRGLSCFTDEYKHIMNILSLPVAQLSGLICVNVFKTIRERSDGTESCKTLLNVGDGLLVICEYARQQPKPNGELTLYRILVSKLTYSLSGRGSRLFAFSYLPSKESSLPEPYQS